MTSVKAGLAVLIWTTVFLVSLILATTHVFFVGFVAGSIVTALSLALTVKWSIEGLLSDTFEGVEEMQEQLEEQRPDLYDTDR